MTRQKWPQILFTLFILCSVALLIRLYIDLQAMNRAKSLRAEVLSHIEIGMSRSEVESIVQKAITHYYCGWGEGASRDYYLFDPDPNRAATISLTFDKTEQGELLTGIYNVEYYLVEPYTSHCIKDP